MDFFMRNFVASCAIDLSIFAIFTLYMWALVAETKDTLRCKRNININTVREAVNKGDVGFLIFILFLFSMGGLYIQFAFLL